MSSQDIIVRLRMLGAQAFNSAAKGASSAVRDIGQATEETSKKSKGFGNSLDRAGSALSGVWVMAGRAAAGLGAAGVAATGMGLKFNAGMEQSRVAFTNLLGSGEEANAMLDRLYKIAAHTPFEFPQLTQSTQRLLGFGMAAKDVIPTMSAVGDAVAAAGGGAEQIDRVSTALGQMQAKGKVSSEELLQLAESGVPALKILQDQLGLTGEELTKQLRDGAITADKGISALVRGMNKRYGGMAEAQSKTFSGMLSTLKDNATQLLGTVTLPLFTFLRDKVLPAVNRITEGISKWVKAGGIQQVTAALRAGLGGKTATETAGFGGALGVIVKVGRVVGTIFRAVSQYAGQFLAALKPAQPFLQNVLIPLLTGLAKGTLGGLISAFKILIPIVRIIATVLGWVGTQAKPLAPWIERIGFVIGFIYSGPILKAIGGLSKLGGLFRIVGGAARIAAGPVQAFGKVIERVIGFVGRLVGALGRVLPEFVKFGKGMIQGIVDGIKSMPGAVLNAIKGMVPGPVKWLAKKVPGLSWLGAGAEGLGPVSRPGVALVGERGPELVTLNRGASVIPMPGFGDTVVPVYLDGREITRVVARRSADRRARR
jgi:tape measure domain-containing protein